MRSENESENVMSKPNKVRGRRRWRLKWRKRWRLWQEQWQEQCSSWSRSQLQSAGSPLRRRLRRRCWRRRERRPSASLSHNDGLGRLSAGREGRGFQVAVVAGGGAEFWVFARLKIRLDFHTTRVRAHTHTRMLGKKRCV